MKEKIEEAFRWFLDEVGPRVVAFWVAVLILILCVAPVFMAIGIYQQSKQPTVELPLNRWHCSKQVESKTTQAVVAGKLVTTVHGTELKCVEYKRN